MIDTHAHLNDPAFDVDRDEILQKACSNGIQKIIDVSEDLKSARRSLHFFEKENKVWSTVGFHPHLVSPLKEKDLNEYRMLLKMDKVVAIGEIGLDYYYENQPKDIQKKAFEQMLDLALETGIPVIIHNRDSDQDLIKCLSGRVKEGLKGLIHCYTGTLETARVLLDFGFYLSFSGIITFKNANELREVVRQVPLDKILAETDAPYLAPIPMRGKRNEPSYIQYTFQEIARVKVLDLLEVQRAVMQNAEKLFSRMK